MTRHGHKKKCREKKLIESSVERVTAENKTTTTTKTTHPSPAGLRIAGRIGREGQTV